jgi:hypothetical protein
MSNLAMMMGLGSGGAGGDNVADFFSTTLYTGTGAEQTITNGIDLAGEGGLVWLKARNQAYNHNLFDTERGIEYRLNTNTTVAQVSAPALEVTSSGFVITSGLAGYNGSGDSHVSWTWRKAPAFFDIQTWTGDGTAGRAIPHNLGGPVGCYFVKCTSDSYDWIVWHKDLSSNEHDLVLNTTAAEANYGLFSTTAPDSSNVYLGSQYFDYFNSTGRTYVAYIFAHNEDLIQCGSYTGNGSTDGPEIDLGWPAQWVMTKEYDGTGDWSIMDTARDPYVLRANLTNTELFPDPPYITQTSTGFKITATSSRINTINDNYIYIAIRAEG